MNAFTRRALVVPTLALSAALLAPSLATAHPGGSGVSDEGVIAPGSEEFKQHDEDTEDGHLPGKQENVTLVGKADIDGGADAGRVADVAAFGTTAYLTVRDPGTASDDPDAAPEGCSDAGIAIMDISDPSNPVQTGFIDATEGSFPGEGADVLDVATDSFTGQILLFNNEICGEGGLGGASLWDVTDPANPVVLAANTGDTTAGDEDNPTINNIHSVLGWTDGAKAYAVLVDNVEAEDVDILDISDPRNPVLISETDLNDFDVLQEENTPLGGNSFLHDVEVQEIDGVMTMVASYWDGGWTLLDVDDPANPVYLRDFDYPAVDAETGLSPSEGNAHQAEFSPDGSLIIGTDEDFGPFRLTFTSAAGDIAAAQGSDTPQLDSETRLAGTPVYLGTACDADGPLAAGDGSQIAVIERGACTFTEKAGNVDEAGGYTGVVLFNSAVNCTNGIVTPSVEGDLPFVSISRAAGFGIFESSVDSCEATPFAIGTTGDAVSAAAQFDGWGYTRLMDTATLTEIGTYAIPESLDPAFAEGFGDLSVHEVAVDPNIPGLAYLSHYAGGLRVVEYGTDGIEEVGAYIDDAGNNFWGVDQHTLPATETNPARNLILASDRDSGLWIFQYTPEVEEPVYLRSYLTGAKEVGPGDPDGRGFIGLKVTEDTVDFGVSWEAIGAPQGGHIHLGASGVNGDIVIPLWTSALPDGTTAVSGSVADVDPALLDQLVAKPAGFYANLHTAEFPNGAVRGQLVPSGPRDLTSPPLNLPLTADMSGAQEVGTPGDPDATANGFLRARGTKVEYAFQIDGFTPIAGHVHEAPAGTNGPIVVPLFASPDGLPSTLTGIAGRVYGVDAALVRDIANNPSDYYLNLHTPDFPAGAARGQLN